jgi:hypothetical protein
VVRIEVLEHLNFSSTEALLMLCYYVTELIKLLGGGTLLVLRRSITELIELLSGKTMLILSHDSVVSRLVNTVVMLRLHSKAPKFVDA